MSNAEYVNSGPQGRARVLDLYYMNVDAPGMLHADFVSNAEAMMRDVDLGLSEAEIAWRVQEAFEHIEPQARPEYMKDRVVAMPIQLLSTYFDTQLERREAVDLYESLLRRSQFSMRPVHTLDCLEYESFATIDCEHSGACPRIAIGLKLAEMAMYGYHPIFEEVMGPMHDDYELGRAKMMLAVRFGYMHKKRSGDISAGYFTRHAEYRQAMSNRFGGPLPDTDS